MDRSTARRKYAQQRANARKRGIEWEFTFEEWCAIWEPHWADRGSHRDGKVMCRTHDAGPYRVDNVRIDSPKGNAAERALMRACGRAHLWQATRVHTTGRLLSGAGFTSHGSSFLRPDKALELQQEEYEWIPGED